MTFAPTRTSQPAARPGGSPGWGSASLPATRTTLGFRNSAPRSVQALGRWQPQRVSVRSWKPLRPTLRSGALGIWRPLHPSLPEPVCLQCAKVYF